MQEKICRLVGINDCHGQWLLTGLLRGWRSDSLSSRVKVACTQYHCGLGLSIPLSIAIQDDHERVKVTIASYHVDAAGVPVDEVASAWLAEADVNSGRGLS